MKLRQALKIYNRVDTPRERPWKQNTVGAALRRYRKTDTSKAANVLWDDLMRARRRQMAAEDFEDFGDEFDYDDWEEEWDEAAEECGLLPPHLGGGCTLGGTEHCDFDCPFRDHPEMLQGDPNPRAKGQHAWQTQSKSSSTRDRRLSRGGTSASGRM